MDVDRVRAFCRLRTFSVLPRVLREFLRRRTFRYEGRLAAHCCLYAAAVFSQLVSAALSVRVRRLSLRELGEELPHDRIPGTHYLRTKLCRRCTGRSQPRGPKGTAFEIFVRYRWFATIRCHHSVARIWSDARGGTHLARARHGNRGASAYASDRRGVGQRQRPEDA